MCCTAVNTGSGKMPKADARAGRERLAVSAGVNHALRRAGQRERAVTCRADCAAWLESAVSRYGKRSSRYAASSSR